MTDQQLLRDRRCYICLHVIPEAEGLWWTDCGFLTCYPGCWNRAIAVEKDRSRTKRGKRRSLPEFRALLRAMRPVVETP